MKLTRKLNNWIIYELINSQWNNEDISKILEK